MVPLANNVAYDVILLSLIYIGVGYLITVGAGALKLLIVSIKSNNIFKVIFYTLVTLIWIAIASIGSYVAIIYTFN